MAIYHALKGYAEGGDIGFINMQPSPRLDVTGIDKYYDSLLKARLYVKEQESKGKPDLEMYKEKLKGLKGRSGDVQKAAENLQQITADLNAGVSQNVDWNVYSRTDEFQKKTAKFNDWVSELANVEHNYDLAQKQDELAKDPKNGKWAKVNGQLVFADTNGLSLSPGPGKVPATWSIYNQMKFIDPTVGKDGRITADTYSNEFGSFEDTQDALNKAFTGLGENGYEGDPQLKPVADGLGGYISAMTTAATSNNYAQVADARDGFLKTLQGSSSRAYNGLLDSYYESQLHGNKDDFGSYVDQTIGKLIDSKLKSNVKKTASHVAGLGSGNADDYDKGLGYWGNQLENTPSIAGDFSRPLSEIGFVFKDGTYQTKDIVSYQLYSPEKPKPGEPLGPGTKLSTMKGLSLSTPAGQKVDVKDLNGYLTGNIIDQKAIWQVYDKGQWRSMVQEETDAAGLGSGKPFDASKYRLGKFFKTGIVATSESAARITGVSEKDKTNSTGIVSALYEPGIFLNGINDAFKGDKSVKARKLDTADDEIIKQLKASSPEASMDFMDEKSNWTDGDAVYFEGWVEADPSDYIAYDKPYDKYYLPANANTREKLQQASGAYLSPQQKAQFTIKK